jgi:hypothetical protein
LFQPRQQRLFSQVPAQQSVLDPHAPPTEQQTPPTHEPEQHSEPEAQWIVGGRQHVPAVHCSSPQQSAEELQLFWVPSQQWAFSQVAPLAQSKVLWQASPSKRELQNPPWQVSPSQQSPSAVQVAPAMRQHRFCRQIELLYWQQSWSTLQAWPMD